MVKEKSMEDPVQINEVFIYLCVSDASAAIKFYSRVFDTEELFRLADPNGGIAHAELRLGPVTMMLSEEYPEYGIRSPKFYGGTGATIHLHVDNIDILARQAEEAGAEILMEPTDQSHGERQCRLRDPFGHEWLLGHEIEKVSPEEMQRRLNDSYSR